MDEIIHAGVGNEGDYKGFILCQLTFARIQPLDDPGAEDVFPEFLDKFRHGGIDDLAVKDPVFVEQL